MPRISTFYGITIWMYWNEWSALHQDELRINWERARRDEPLQPIEPLP